MFLVLKQLDIRSIVFGYEVWGLNMLFPSSGLSGLEHGGSVFMSNIGKFLHIFSF
jgi:hypothetical protein